ncbi:Orn/Lys/Arg family decarboxylase [Roseateles albus]|uniref:Orn/Lys/Arg decarboxylase N-terminal domain-containing protein n=1 Tax=Roseateles albus TaxID=2987525 RepID=A0ABT5KBX9_9BURK|nr:Orn/Lys/Arg decarboxylase N-terminal domain-containing protein [Roseateles albus]MDC8771447.1 Orn/Lys/Arg decarboxylase N-terminal domain-containing protein [Roseateles albus]
MASSNSIPSRVLCVDGDLAGESSTASRRIRAIVDALREHGVEVIESLSYEDGLANLVSDTAIHCLLLDWSLGANDEGSHAAATDLLRKLRKRNEAMPVFLMADRKALSGPMTVEVASLADEFIWTLEDSPAFIARRVEAALDRYFDGLLPPFARALVNYNRDAEYSWAAPGHQGGVAFTKSPIGRLFHDAYGETLFRTDMGIERGALGSLLSHSGPIGESEQYAARVFGSDRSYSVLNGTSASNRTIMSACIGEQQIALCDRNCHKSIEQGLAITGGIPVFLQAGRNRYGVIGPIHPDQMTPAAIAAKIAANPLAAQAKSQRAVYSVVTNCTYDGMCYDAKSAEALLGQSVDRIHFDEAWYGYARFNPMYRDRYAMRGAASSHADDGPTVYATHSTHKLLAALSQTSFIHVRDGRGAIDHGRFNEAYGAQASTSPLYALIASNEVAAAMMAGPSGEALTQDVIDEAIACRQAVAQVQRELAAKGEWFFTPWNAPEVTDPATGVRYAFADAPADLLAHEPSCWVLHPGESWHGFDALPDGWCLLDPIKFAVVAPGMQADGQLAEQGIPCDLVTAYLGQHGIVPSRTTAHMVLFLFSMGVTKGKWGTLINALLDFKRDYDANKPLAEVLPRVLAAAPARYAGMGLKDLGDQMWAELRAGRMGHWEAEAYAQLPKPVCTPRVAFQALMAGEVELVPLNEMANRVVTVGVIPYPPGIPIVMPGENIGPADGAWISYLRVLQHWAEAFPGFAKEVEGTIEKDGVYSVYCLKS